MNNPAPPLPQKLLDYVVESVDRELNSNSPWTGIVDLSRQVIRALAFLYAKADTPFRESPKIADSLSQIYKLIRQDGLGFCGNRLLLQLAESRILLQKAGALDLLPGIDSLLIHDVAHYVGKLESYRYLTHFTAQNLDTGPNHAAVYTCLVHRIGQIFSRDDLLRLALSTWDRIAADQNTEGYWAETTGGPSMLYNHITMLCAGRMAHWTGNAFYHEVAQRAAAFHRRFSYPDGTNIETIDGRVRYSTIPELMGGFVQSHTAQGRALVARKMETHRKLTPIAPQARHVGERIANLCEDHELWVSGPMEKLDLDKPHYLHTLPGPAAVRRHGTWVSVMQAMVHLPQGRGGYTIDRTSLWSLWSEKCGLIVNGSGEPGEHAAQSFHFRRIHEYDACWYSVPEFATIKAGTPAGDDPMELIAEYRGGTAVIKTHFVSNAEIRVEVRVRTRTDFYPVLFTVQLELRMNSVVNGLTLGEGELKLSSRDLGGRIDAGRFSVSFPEDGASFCWPHDPYNPYDRKEFKSPRGKLVSLLNLPVGPAGAELVFRCPA